jgi:anti-sigma-K factor RskA
LADRDGEDRNYEATARLVRTAVPPARLPIGLEGRVMIAVDRDARGEHARPARRLRRPWYRFSFAAAAGAAAGAAAVAVLLAGRGGAGTLELEALMRPPAGGPAQAAIEVRKTGIGRVIAIRTDDLPILPKGEYYELWFVSPGGEPRSPNRISAGTFHPDEHGRTDVRLAAAVDPALYPVLSITAEPGDGDPRPSRREALRSSATPSR